MLNIIRKSAFLTLALLSFLPATAQKAALKTNLFSDALLSPSLGLEVGVARKWTLELDGQVNFWNINNHRAKHILLYPEVKYWFCRRFAGHFLGLHLIGDRHNVGNIDLGLNFLGSDFRKLKDRRYQGWGAGAGISYGYDWAVHPRWNIEAEIGLGWLYTRNDVYPCSQCGTRIARNRPHNYFGPTKAAINIVYLFK